MTRHRPTTTQSQIFNFYPKVLERKTNFQLIAYFNENNSLPDCQLANKRVQSTEMAVLKVVSDIIDAIANGKITLLSLLDLTAAFNTVDHSILLQHLETTFSFNDVILQRSIHIYWIGQSVHANGKSTRALKVIYGVPQGSVLGAMLFTLYTADIGGLIRSLDSNTTHMQMTTRSTHHAFWESGCPKGQKP